MVEENNKSVEYILCGCNCGTRMLKYDERGRERKYIKGHFTKGKKLSEQHLKNLSIAQQKRGLKGENNPFYGKQHSEDTRKHWSEIRTGRITKPCSDKTKQKISEANKGRQYDEKHRLWKGDDVGYRALHLYVRRRLSMPLKCIICNDKSPTQLANITGIYNRELKNWGYMCKSCHLKYDNIIERNLRKRRLL